jgi:hypothetical protein
MKTRAPYFMLVATLLLAGTTHAAEMTIFKQPNFTGAKLTLRGYTPNLAERGFSDQTSSIVVSSGRWEVCTQPDFRGDCLILDRGRYATLDRSLNDRIESAREVGSRAPEASYQPLYRGSSGGISVPRTAEAPAPNFTPNVDIELFLGANYQNGGYATQRDMSQLDPEFDDKTSSAIVAAGQWQLCTERNYGGRCVVFGPGRYPDLGAMNNQVSSLRRIR